MIRPFYCCSIYQYDQDSNKGTQRLMPPPLLDRNFRLEEHLSMILWHTGSRQRQHQDLSKEKMTNNGQRFWLHFLQKKRRVFEYRTITISWGRASCMLFGLVQYSYTLSTGCINFCLILNCCHTDGIDQPNKRIRMDGVVQLIGRIGWPHWFWYH